MSESEQKFYQQSPIQGVDWPEDFDHENGNYMCECCVCHDNFYGHKRRVICKKCATKPEEQRDNSTNNLPAGFIHNPDFKANEGSVEQRHKTLSEIFKEAGMIGTEHNPATNSEMLEAGLEAVAAEAVRRAKAEELANPSDHCMTYCPQIMGESLQEQLARQAELIRVLVEALRMTREGMREVSRLANVNEATREIFKVIGTAANEALRKAEGA